MQKKVCQDHKTSADPAGALVDMTLVRKFEKQQPSYRPIQLNKGLVAVTCTAVPPALPLQKVLASIRRSAPASCGLGNDGTN